MEVIKGAASVITSCLNTRRFNPEAYVYILSQGYLPPCSAGFLRRRWIAPECVQRSAEWFTELARSYQVEVDLGEMYLARAGFVMALLQLKRVFEYEWITLPGDVKEMLNSAPVDLDYVAGNLWPALLSMGLGVQVSRDLRRVGQFITPLAIFGMVSDILRTYGLTQARFTVTGFGRFVDRLMDRVLASSQISDLKDVIKSLVAISKVHSLALQELSGFLQRDWYVISKSLSSNYIKYGGIENLYTEEDVRLDVAHFIIAAVDHYNGLLAFDVKKLLSQHMSTEHLSHPRDTITTVVRRFFAKRVRLW